MSTAIWTHRCEHVSPGQPGTVHDLGMGITAELCEKCRAELVTRLGEKPAPVELHLDFSPPPNFRRRASGKGTAVNG